MLFRLKLREGGKVMGPLPSKAIVERITSGKVDGEAFVRLENGGDNPWIPIDEVNEFSAALAPRKRRESDLVTMLALGGAGLGVMWTATFLLHDLAHLPWPFAIGLVVVGAPLLLAAAWKWGF